MKNLISSAFGLLVAILSISVFAVQFYTPAGTVDGMVIPTPYCNPATPTKVAGTYLGISVISNAASGVGETVVVELGSDNHQYTTTITDSTGAVSCPIRN